jgi:hypothetical protein
MSIVDALRLEGEGKKRLLVDRLETACRRAEMHLSYGKYVMDTHNTGRHCIGDELFGFSKQAAEHLHRFEETSCHFIHSQTPIPTVTTFSEIAEISRVCDRPHLRYSPMLSQYWQPFCRSRS